MKKKNSIKRAQSQARLSFAERKNFRPMAKILTLLVLLMTAVTGAWATDYYVVGTMTGWQKNDQYKMTLNASAATTEYQLGIALAATDEFKVIGVDGDNPWVWYPGGDNYGQNGELTAEGLYTIYFRPNGDGGSDWFYNCIYVADGVNLTADGEAWTLAQMPACNVELEVEYFALATLATLPAAAEGVVEGTDAALLTPGTSAEGTLAYAIGTSEAPTGQWSDAIPTAQDLEAGICYVWYKVVGDAEHSDSQPQSIPVTIAEAPAYAVTIDDGNVDASKWEAPTEQKTGQTVTLSYSGKKKIRSITIEKAAAPAEETYKIEGVVNNNAINFAEAATLPFTKKVKELFADLAAYAEQISIDNITVSGNVEMGTLAGWDTEITFTGEGTGQITLSFSYSGLPGQPVTYSITVTKN